MAAKDILLHYYDTLKQKQDWSQFLADDLIFRNNGKELHGKKEYIESTKRFFQ